MVQDSGQGWQGAEGNESMVVGAGAMMVRAGGRVSRAPTHERDLDGLDARATRVQG